MCVLYSLSGRNNPSNTNTIHIYCLLSLSGRNIPSNTNTIHIYCSLPLSGRNIPSNTNTVHIDCCVCVCVLYSLSGRNNPSNTNTIHIYFPLSLSGRNIPSNTNTIHIYCCCVSVVFTFRPEYSVQYKYNTHLLLLCLCCIHFPAGIFRPIQIQYTLIVVVCVLYSLSGRNNPSNTNTIHIYCLLSLSGRNFPAGKLSPIQIQYTFIVVVSCFVFIFRPEFSGRNIPSNTNKIHL